MLPLLLLLFVWPTSPLQEPYAVGQKLALDRHGIAKVGEQWRKPAGTVFNGYWHAESQQAWLMAPGCASEWLGWLTGRELAGTAASQKLWTSWTDQHQGEFVIVLLLTAFPKRMPITAEPQNSASRWGLEELKAALTVDGVEAPLREQSIFERLSGNTDAIAKEYPFGEAAGLCYSKPTRAGLHPYYVPLGPYYGAVWVLRFDGSKAPDGWREAKFSFLSRTVRTDVMFAQDGKSPPKKR